ncbi:hypothetical protein GF371_00125 [Candidatus Woesearchaeota archaeon]|nr:hypothetical protein [Candidatus Woesearchaeota archaeon]
MEFIFNIFMGVLVLLVIYWIFAGARKQREMLYPNHNKQEIEIVKLKNKRENKNRKHKNKK